MSHFSTVNIKKECIYSVPKFNICRACLTEDLPLESLESLSKVVEPLKMTLSEMMMCCTELQVSMSDIFPQNLCFECVEQLCNSYNFKLKCERSFETLNRQMHLDHFDQGIDHKEFIAIKCEVDTCIDDRLEETSIITDYVEKTLVEPPVSAINTNEHEEIEEEPEKKFRPNETIFLETQISDINFIPDIKEIQRKTEDDKNSHGEETTKSKSKKLKNHACTSCSKKFDSVLRLEKHKSSIHAKKPYLCSDCGHVCKGSTAYQAHVASHSNNRPFVCAECGKKYKSRSSLLVHHRYHTGERRYSCEHCGSTFITYSSMKGHVKTYHTTEKNHVCSVCSAAFKRSAHLVYHMRHHTGEKPYACSECDMSFKTHNDRKCHMVKHTGERKYPCTICTKRFARSFHLTQHMVTHTGERNHVCKLCTKAFTQAHVLRSHMSKHHPGVSVKSEPAQ